MNILLTGASRGIGAAAFELLKTGGHDVVGHSSRGGDGLIGGDLTDPSAPRQVWEQALARLGGRIDVLINSAGIFEGVADDAPDEEWHASWARTMQVNLQSAADFSRLAIGHFRENGGGRIVNVSSRAAWRGDTPQHWHYAASKAGMAAMTKTIARGYASQHIYCYAVCPGWTVTELAADHVDESVVADIPLGSPATTGEVAEAIRWLAIDAPASATGALIDINGASYVR
jgi:3-oxoacyl-[acyl-carrier protein] reductase